MSTRKQPVIGVVGSLNMDLVMKVERMPQKGETLLGGDFRMVWGGKGANQALTARKLGAETIMLGRVGDDSFGATLIDNLAKEGVVTRYIIKDKTASSGTAMIMVDKKGENSILVAPGANMNCSPEDIKRFSRILAAVDILLLQLEIPLKTVKCAIAEAKKYNKIVILDAGPARKGIPTNILRSVDILSPNETEAEILVGFPVKDVKSAGACAQKFLEMGVKKIVIKMGERGVFVQEEGISRHLPAVKVKAVDTTGAGDAFCGGLAVAYARCPNLFEAVEYANFVGALTVTKFGAQTSIPGREEVNEFIRAKRHKT